MSTIILLLIAILAADHIEATDPTCTKKLDILIGVDASTSVCGHPVPCPNWEYIHQCIVKIVNGLTIGPNDTRIALLTASSAVKIEFNLNRYKDKAALLSGIGKVEYKGGEIIDLWSTWLIFTDILKPEFGDRAGVPNVLIGFTDGVPFLDTERLAGVVKHIQVTGTKAIIACIEPGCSESFAKAVAPEPKQANADYFMVDNFSSLGSIEENLLKQICS